MDVGFCSVFPESLDKDPCPFDWFEMLATAPIVAAGIYQDAKRSSLAGLTQRVQL